MLCLHCLIATERPENSGRSAIIGLVAVGVRLVQR